MRPDVLTDHRHHIIDILDRFRFAIGQFIEQRYIHAILLLDMLLMLQTLMALMLRNTFPCRQTISSSRITEEKRVEPQLLISP